ncbi:endomucin isoform X2 [Lacerta agilis]|uniref:endomucin isoform X2 n=1 Tax=Lacerta agilis TaxID=80427 RepID=UPI00141969ED|nr:endomucin isoform X2 [Lacerta agilis]
MLNVICTGSTTSTTTISTTKASQETSSTSTSKAATAGITTTTANSSAAAQPTQASAHGSLSTSNDTASTGTAESPALSSVTSSHLALTTPDQHNKTTTERAPPNENATQRSIPDTLQKVTEAPTESNTANAHSENQDHPSYTTIILPVIIALIVISLSVFLLVTLYRMCLKTTPERQENGTEQAPSDKENVKLISVKTTSPESGDQASQGKNRTRQQNDSSSSHLGNKRV